MRRSEWITQLRACGVEDAETEARLLIEAFCRVKDSTYFADPDATYESEALARAVQERAEGVPLQYLLGEWSFFGLDFCVTKDTLIPRPDTEILVETAIARLPQGAYFADLCTGSGCVGIAVTHERRDTVCRATDLWEPTLAVARENAERNGVSARYTAVRGDLLRGEGFGEKRFDAILSNPPYIPSHTVTGLSREVLHEPHAALDGGEDGLDFYRAIARYAPAHLRAGGCVILEIGYDQAADVRALAAEAGFLCEIIKDLSGNDRVAVWSHGGEGEQP